MNCEERLIEVLDKLALEIHLSHQVSEAQLHWLRNQASVDFTEKQTKKFAELRASLESAITRTESKLMSIISDFSDKVESWQQSISDSVDGIVTSITGLDTDVQALKKQIADLQASPGAITPEDQARLDKIQAAVEGLSSKTVAAASAAAALDAQTEAVPVPVP